MQGCEGYDMPLYTVCASCQRDMAAKRQCRAFGSPEETTIGSTRSRRTRRSILPFSGLGVTLVLLLSVLCQTISASPTVNVDRRKEAELSPIQMISVGDESVNPNLPKAFDASLGTNFTSSACESFFTQMIGNPNFQACHPVSLMLQNSASWFQATKSLVSITQALEVSCQAPLDSCTSLMNNYDNQLLSDDVCLEDFNNQNPLVLEAHAGLVSYPVVYHATCLKDNANPTEYCYADAVTNTSQPSNVYLYFLPLGLPLPAGIVPTCNYCLQSTMASFATYASNSSQPTSSSYPAAAQEVNMYCGPSFAATDIKVANSAAASLPGRTSTATSMLVAATVWLISFI